MFIPELPQHGQSSMIGDLPTMWTDTEAVDGTAGNWKEAALGSIYIRILSGSVDFYTKTADNDATADWRPVVLNLSSPTAFVDVTASTTATASLRIRSGTAPTSPNDGDIWFDGTDLHVQVSGASYTLDKTAV